MAESKIRWRDWMGGAAIVGAWGAGLGYYDDTRPYLRCAGNPCPRDLPHYAERLRAMHDGALTNALWCFGGTLVAAVFVVFVQRALSGIVAAEKPDRDRFEALQQDADQRVP